MTAWAERLAERSPTVQRSRDRSVQQARVLVDAARRLIAEQGENFTTQELVREAGVALQTFYRYFASKDELLLAVLEDLIREGCEGFAARAEGLTDPIERLRSHVLAVAEPLTVADDNRAGARFIASEHWRLSAIFPDEMVTVTRPFSSLVEAEIIAATATGQLVSADPARDAWMVTQLLLSVFHHHSFADTADPTVGDDLWRFCLHGLGAG